MKKLIALMFLLAYSHPSWGQIRVEVSGETDADTQGIVNRIGGKVGSSSRYALATKDIVILFSLNCISVSENRIVCEAEMSYWPFDEPMHVDLTSDMAIGPPEYVAETLFDQFVKETSDEELKDRADHLKKQLDEVKAKAWYAGFLEGNRPCAPKPK